MLELTKDVISGFESISFTSCYIVYSFSRRKSLGTCASFGCDCNGRARLGLCPPCARCSVVAVLV